MGPTTRKKNSAIPITGIRLNTIWKTELTAGGEAREQDGEDEGDRERVDGLLARGVVVPDVGDQQERRDRRQRRQEAESGLLEDEQSRERELGDEEEQREREEAVPLDPVQDGVYHNRELVDDRPGVPFGDVVQVLGAAEDDRYWISITHTREEGPRA